MDRVNRFARVAALALVAVVAGCGGPSPSATAEASTASLPSPARTQASDDHYLLSFELPKTTWHTNEAITGTATLTLVQPTTMTVWGSGTGLVGFVFDQVGDDKKLDWVRTADCAPRDLAASSPIVIGLYKTWPIAADATPDPQIHLPVGDWKISAVADFTEELCGGIYHNLEASLVIQIVP